MSREVITEYAAHGTRPRNVTITITTDEAGRMTIEAIDLPGERIPELLHQATQVVKRMKNALLKSSP